MQQPIAPSTARTIKMNLAPIGIGANHSSYIPEKSRKRSSININGACEGCRRGKRKCDGVRPVCAACSKRHPGPNPRPCVYDTHEGLSRNENMKLNIKKYKDQAQDLRTFLTDLIDQAAPESTIQDLCRQMSVMGPENLPESLGDVLKQSIRTRGLQQDMLPLISPKIETFSDDFLNRSEVSVASSSHGSILSAASTLPYLESRTDSQSTGPMTARPGFPCQEIAWNPREVHKRSHMSRQPSPDSSSLDEGSLLATHQIWEARIAAHNQRRVYQKVPQNPRQNAEESSHLHVYSHHAFDDTVDGAGQAADAQIVNYTVPVFSMLPLWTDCASAFSQTIVHFINLARERIKNRWDPLRILSTNKVNLDTVLSTGTPVYDQTVNFDVDTWALAVVQSFSPDMVPELKIAGYIKLTRLVSWLIVPSETTFAAIPAGFRPTPASRFYAHPPELSFLAWRDLADALILNQEETFDPSWSQTVMHCARLEWPAPDAGVRLTCTDPATRATMLSVQGEAYITDQQNWVFDKGIRAIAPDLNLTKGRFGRPRGGPCSLLEHLRVVEEDPS